MEALDNKVIVRPKTTLERWLAPFSRIQSGGRFIPVVDGLRFLAIMSVIMFHWAFWVLEKKFAGVSDEATKSHLINSTLGVLDNGRLGVELFFAISGFILASPFAKAWLDHRARPKLGAYFLRRVTRLEPPYMLNLIVMFVLLVVRKHNFWEQLPHLFASMTYTHNAIYNNLSTINFVTWSLEIEVQFYILAPLLACVFAIENKWLRRGVIVGAMLGIPYALLLWRGNAPPEVNGGWVSLCLLGQIQFFLSGFLLCDLYLTDWKSAPPRLWILDLAFIALAAIFLVDRNWFDGYQRLLLPFLTLMACICAFCGNWTRRFFEHPLIATIGGMCYSIYLYHEVLIWAIGPRIFKYQNAVLRPFGVQMEELSFPLACALQLLIVAPFILLVTAMLFVFTERPFMRRDWYAHLFGRKPAALPVIDTPKKGLEGA